MHWILIAVILVSLVLVIIIEILFNAFFVIFFLLVVEDLLLLLLLVIILILISWLFIVIFLLLLAILVIFLIQLRFLDHALKMLKDHLTSEEASYQGLNLYDGDQSSLIDLDVVLLLLIALTLPIVDAGGGAFDIVPLMLLFIWSNLHIIVVIMVLSVAH